MLCCFDNVKQNISCDNEFHQTQHHQRDVTEWKNFSRIIGLSLLLFMLFMATVVKCTILPKTIWADIVLEKEEKVLMEEQGKWVGDKLKKRVKDHINKREWKKCLCVGNELMTDMFHLQDPEDDQTTENTTTSIDEIQTLLPPDEDSVGPYGTID